MFLALQHDFCRRERAAVIQHTLTQGDVRFFHNHGYLGPFRMITREEMSQRRELLERLIYGNEVSSFTSTATKSRHLDSRLVYELCAHPAIVDRVQQILGPNLILWQSNFFNKEPHAKAYPWHQDANFWAGVIEPPVAVSGWLAIDDADLNNGCVQLLPGSHKRLYPHIKTDSFDPMFSQQADPAHVPVDKKSIISMSMKAGEFFLFNERLLHRSSRNDSEFRRLGLAIRLTTTITRVNKDHPVVLVCGDDAMGFNTLCEPPPA